MGMIMTRNIYASDSTKTTTSPSLWEVFVTDLEASGKKSLSFLSSPARGSLTDYLYFTGGSAVIMGFIAIDERTSLWIRDARLLDEGPMEQILSASKNWGERDYAIGAVALGYATGLVTGEEKIRRISRLCGESLLFSAALTGAGKVLAGRYRPAEDNSVSNWDWNIWESRDNHHSFPSGHATVAFALSSVLAQEIDGWAFDAGIYTLASLTALSRVDDGRHWLADVIAGATIGTLCGIYVTSEEDRLNDKGTSWMLVPSLNGMTVLYTF